MEDEEDDEEEEIRCRKMSGMLKMLGMKRM